MRFFLSTSAFVLLFLFLDGIAAAEDARAVLDRAIEAHGGAARLERTKKGYLKAKLEGGSWDAGLPAELEETFDLPGRYRQTIDGTINGVHVHEDGAVSGNKAWKREGAGPVRDDPAGEPPPVSQHWHAILALLLSLRDEKVQLASLPDETKDGRTLAGIRPATRQGLGDLFFDKSTGLLARVRRTQQNFLGVQVPIGETLFDDYRDIQGVRYPMKFKTVGDATPSMLITILSIDFRDKIDDSVFVKPQTPVAEGPIGADREKEPALSDRTLIVVTAISGGVIGAVWFIVRASKRGKRETSAR